MLAFKKKVFFKQAALQKPPLQASILKRLENTVFYNYQITGSSKAPRNGPGALNKPTSSHFRSPPLPRPTSSHQPREACRPPTRQAEGKAVPPETFGNTFEPAFPSPLAPLFFCEVQASLDNSCPQLSQPPNTSLSRFKTPLPSSAPDPRGPPSCCPPSACAMEGGRKAGGGRARGLTVRLPNAPALEPSYLGFFFFPFCWASEPEYS